MALFAIRGAVRLASRRAFSTGAGLVQVEPAVDGVAVIKLSAPPANALSLEVLQQLNAVIRAVEADKAAKAAVLTSATSVFSAGLDIKEMAQPKKERFDAWWGELQTTFPLLYASRKPLVAAINGAAPAGGCWLALGCEHRVMAQGPKSVIGLNETQLGIVAPTWIAQPLVLTAGYRVAERMLLLGQLSPAEQAKAEGVVDELAAPEELMARAVAAAKKLGAIPREARHRTKIMLRSQLLGLLDTPEKRAADLKFTWDFITSAPVQEGIARYLAALSAPKTKAA